MSDFKLQGGSELNGGIFTRNPPVDENNLVSLYYAAVVLLEEVSLNQ